MKFLSRQTISIVHILSLKTNGVQAIARLGKYDPLDIQVGRRLRQARVDCGLTQTALGKALGVSFQQVQKYEVGSNRMAVSTALRACAILDVTISDLLEGIDDNLLDRRHGGGALDQDKDLPPRKPPIQRLYHAIASKKDREAVRHIIERLAQ